MLQINDEKTQAVVDLGWEIEGLNDEDIAIETLDERLEFSTVRPLWDCGCDGTNCGIN